MGRERLGEILSSSAITTVQMWALLQIRCTRLDLLVPPASLASHVKMAFVLQVMLRSQQLRGEALRMEAVKEKALMSADTLELEALQSGKLVGLKIFSKPAENIFKTC